MENVELIVLDRRDFLPLLRRHPEISFKLIDFLCQKLRRTTEQMEYLFLGPETKFAKAVIKLAEDYGRSTEDGMLVDAKLTQRELGSIVG